MIKTSELTIKTKGNGDIIDITAQAQKCLTDSEITNGIVTVFVTHSTCGITTVEYEPGLIEDLGKLWERIAPQNIPYGHDARWGDGNGYAHIRASLLGASLTLPCSNKHLTLGSWQQIILVDFDNRARTRTVVVQVMGE